LALAVSVVLVGCSDDGGSSGGGDSVKVMVIGALESSTLSVPQIADGVQAAAKAVNADGGIAGKQVEVLTCNTREDENEAVGCARKAVEEGVIAVVGSSTTKSGAVLPVLEKAGIASIPAYPISPEDFTSDNSYPISGGSLVEFPGAAQLLLGEANAKKIGVVALDNASGEKAANAIDTTVKAEGGSVGTVSRIPAAGGGDTAPQLQAAAGGGAGGVVIVLSQGPTSSILQEADQSGLSIPLAGSDGQLTDAAIPKLGGAAEGFYTVGSAPPAQSDHPAAVQYREEMAADGKADKEDGMSILSWTTLHVLAEVSKDLEDVNAETVTEALNTVSGLDYLWLTDYSTTQGSTIEGMNRLFNTRVYMAQVREGKKTLLQPDSVPVNLGGETQ
jgi:ABC-type branched-subunit amino acid transport system substrate-binding protein